MRRAERQKAILEMLNPTVPVRNRELIERFQVTDMTIRRDLDALAAQGKLIRTHGGAILVSAGKERAARGTAFAGIPSDSAALSVVQLPIDKRELEPAYLSRAASHADRKSAIARTCLTMITEKKYVYLDSGSTTYSIAQMITGESHNFFISNGINIIYELLRHDYPSVISIGGEIDQNTWSTRGAFAENQIRTFHSDITFLACNAISPEGSVMIGNMTEIGLKRAIMDISNEIYLAVDSSKFDSYSLTSYASIADFNGIVTDSRLPPETKNKLEALGARIVIAT